METINGIKLSNLKKGSKGQEVRLLQTLLNSIGYSCGSVDGIFGVKTEKSVLAFTNYKSNEVNIEVWYSLFNKV